MRILAVSAFLSLGLAACSVEHTVTISSDDCDKLKGERREACMERLADAMAKASESFERAEENFAHAEKAFDERAREMDEGMERVGEAMRASEPAPPPAPRP